MTTEKIQPRLTPEEESTMLQEGRTDINAYVSGDMEWPEPDHAMSAKDIKLIFKGFKASEYRDIL